MRVIAIQEISVGNTSVGSMWMETRSFDINTPVSEIINWARGLTTEGKLILSIDRSQEV